VQRAQFSVAKHTEIFNSQLLPINFDQDECDWNLPVTRMSRAAQTFSFSLVLVAGKAERGR